MTKKLWQFEWDVGRMGTVNGLFVATQEEIDGLLGKQIYFGEILGKHSEIYGDLSMSDLKEIDIGEEAINKLVAVTGPTVSGYNPFDYYEEETDE